MRKNKLTGAIKGAGRKAVLSDPVNLSVMVERKDLTEARRLHGNKVNQVVRELIRKMSDHDITNF